MSTSSIQRKVLITASSLCGATVFPSGAVATGDAGAALAGQRQRGRGRARLPGRIRAQLPGGRGRRPGRAGRGRGAAARAKGRCELGRRRVRGLIVSGSRRAARPPAADDPLRAKPEDEARPGTFTPIRPSAAEIGPGHWQAPLGRRVKRGGRRGAVVAEVDTIPPARDSSLAPMDDKSLPEGRIKRGGRRAAVMVDVAKLAGVSYQTVSRVLHDSPHVHRDTRERVLDAIRQLDYRPSSVAQALVTGRSRTLGVVSFDTTHYGPASTLLRARDGGARRGVRRERRQPEVAQPRAGAGRGEGAARPGRRRHHGHRPAAVGGGRAPPRHLRRAGGRRRGGPDDSVPVVAVDQHGGAAAATRHLLDLGHRTVWHIAGPTESLEAEQRVDGWRSTLEAAGVEPPPLLRGDWSARSGYELAPQLARTPGVTAVFVANDQMALGVLRYLHESGRAVPRDISIVGFDDIPEAAYFTPPLTTVRQDFSELGRRCLHFAARADRERPPLLLARRGRGRAGLAQEHRRGPRNR